MKTPIFALNYKTYPTSIGNTAIEIAREVEAKAMETGVQGIVAVPPTMIERVVRSIKGEILVLAQHVDAIKPGRGTGFLTVDMIKEAGAQGSLVNHSEHPLKVSEIAFVVEELEKAGMISLVCADTPQSALAMSAFNPSIIAVEPPELIGTGISVTKAKPEIVTSSITLLRDKAGYNKPILVGAGVSTAGDVKKSLELGADGVLLASAVMKAPDPKAKIAEMFSAFVE